MRKNKLSLIGTSQGGREFELRRMFSSLTGYDHNLEVIFIDQSDDNYVSTIASDFTDLNINIIKSDKCSLSKARNIGLSLCSGNIIGFCDDDAYYNEMIINELIHKQYNTNSLISYPLFSPDDNSFYSNRRFLSKKKKMSYLNIIKNSLSVGTFLFLKGESKESIKFSELLGVGTNLGGSEETELFFRLKKNKFSCQFDPSFFVYHDNDNITISNDKLADKYGMYARGYAIVLKKYFLSSYGLLGIEAISLIFKSLVGALISKNRKIYISRLKNFTNYLVKRVNI
ncbi:TPA: glycosyltransferase family 2 protein [Photobacterium damselae]